MARRKQRVKKGEDQVDEAPRRSGLEEPWPSCPRRNPRYVLYCYNHESERQYIINSYARYAIRKLFDAIVGDNKFERSDARTISFGDIDIKSDEMDEILAHEYTKEEAAWEFGAPYIVDIDNFLHGRRMSKTLDDPTQPKPVRVPREPKPVKERIDRSQFITVQSLAEDIGIDPRDARAALRKAKIEKPAGGWLGDEAWAKGIRDVLKKAKVELAKKGK